MKIIKSNKTIGL